MTMSAKSGIPSRSIVHPGPQTPERFRAVGCYVHPVTLTVRPCRSVNEAIAEAFVEQGFDGGYVRLAGVAMKRLDYVMPAASPDDSHAAWYSQTYSMPGGTIIDAGLHMGRREGKPFLHCHGAWRGEDGGLAMGHLLPFEAEFAEETRLPALALDGALMVTRHDEETNFPLFSPMAQPRKRSEGGSRAILCTIRPNTDLSIAVETICGEFGLGNADVNGIGSLIGVDYEDGTTLTAHASELLIRKGHVHVDGSAPVASMEIAMVDLTGLISGGVLVRGSNPVCVTAELLLSETD